MVFLHPRMASRADISNYVLTLLPSRTNYRCFLTLILINRSPSKFPFLLSLMVSPSLTPLGMTIYYLTFLFCWPLPLQLGQNSFIFEPSPLQELQAACMTKGPWRMVVAPVPLQELHFWGVVPGLHLLPLQVSHLIVRAYSTVWGFMRKKVLWWLQRRFSWNRWSCSWRWSGSFFRRLFYFRLRTFHWGCLRTRSRLHCYRPCRPFLPGNPWTGWKYLIDCSLLPLRRVIITWIRSGRTSASSGGLTKSHRRCGLVDRYLLTSANFYLASGLEFLSGCSYWASL